MRIAKDAENIYACSKCKGNDFGFMKKGNQLGIYCTACGRWLKWADKDEQNLFELSKRGGIAK